MCRVAWALVWRPTVLLAAAVPFVIVFWVSAAQALPVAAGGANADGESFLLAASSDDEPDDPVNHPLSYYDPIHGHLLEDWSRNRRSEDPDNGYEKLWALRQELSAMQGADPPREVLALEVMRALNRASDHALNPGDLRYFIHQEVLIALPQIAGSTIEDHLGQLIEAQVAALGGATTMPPNGGAPIFDPAPSQTVVPVPASGFLALGLIVVGLLGRHRLGRAQAGAVRDPEEGNRAARRGATTTKSAEAARHHRVMAGACSGSG